MKYKVKNTVTGEETLCEKVVIDGFDYYVSNDDIEDETYYISWEKDYATEPKERYVLYVKSTGLNGENPRKVIATTNLSLDLPMVIDEVDYYSVIEQIATSTQPSNSAELNIWHEIVMKMCSDAILAPKETYSYTKEDMVDFVEKVRPMVISAYLGNSHDKTEKELFDLWQGQRTIEILVK